MAPPVSATAVRSLPPAHEPVPIAEAHATLARILGAIEEYVYTGEFLADGGYRVVFAGPCRDRFLGMSVEEAREAVWADYVHPDDVEVFDFAHDTAHATGRLDLEYRLIGADGVVRWVRDRGRLRRQGERRLLDGSILDVSAMHAARTELEAAHAYADHLAHTDALTGADNRRSLPELLVGLAGVPLGLLSLDVDHFKNVNDFYGHAAGDAVLVELAVRLRRTLRQEDRVVRMGGEEFLVLLPGIADEAALEDIAQRVCSSVGSVPVVLGDDLLPVTVSIGATATPAARDFEALLVSADRCLYAAKRAGRNRVHVAAPDGEPEAPIGDDESQLMRIAHAMATVAAAAEGLPDDHLVAVSVLAARTAQRMSLSPSQVLRCRLGGLLHDLGKLRLPADVLTKSGSLDSSEWAQVTLHPGHGAQMLAAVAELAPLAPIVRHHHERYDGTGYPDGLAGDAIPLEARVVAAADAWHAMTSDRPYRCALTAPAALAELEDAAGRQLDPLVVASLRLVVG